MSSFHGKVNCYNGPGGGAKQTSSDAFKNMFDLLSAQTGSGIVTRIAYNTGSGVPGGGTGLYDEANPFGNNAWACFRFNSSSNRSWEWYMLIQTASGSGNFGDAPGNPGTVEGVNEPIGGNEGVLAIQAASMVDISGVSVSPWNGTTGNNGNDNKGDPVWVTQSLDDRMYILPRSNADDGNFSSSRQNMADMFSSTASVLTAIYHIVISEDGLVFVMDAAENNLWSVSYIGTYTPRPYLTSSIPTPLVMFINDAAGAGVLNTGIVVGNRAGNAIWQGGVTLPGSTFSFEIDRYDASIFAVDESSDPVSVNGRPIYNSFGIPLVVYDTEADEYGFVGYIDNELYRDVFGMPNASTTKDGLKAAFAGAAGIKTNKILIPWSGSVAPPRASRKRKGEVF